MSVPDILAADPAPLPGAAPPGSAAPGDATTARRPWLRTLTHSRSLATGLVLLAIVLLVAIIVPLLDPGGATRLQAQDSLAGPGAGRLLGADQLGRDLLTRLAEGYRISLAVSLGSVALALLIGCPLGLLAATGSPRLGGLIMRVLDVLMAFPALLLAIVVVALFGPGTLVLLLAIGIVYTPIIARVMRAAALETSRQSFVEAARARGASYWRLVLRHITPNSLGPVIVQATILMAVSILLEAALSFIGLGVQPPTPSLGLMLSAGRDFMASSPWVVADPAVAILLVVLGFTLVGDGMQEWLDPKKRAIAR
ncbi:ABC transporter permease [Rugosimonospora africana]|uniref:Nickel ABC transporter permease n=1 Tax=Rugosimonospora africana TaxID=556532 RepID=A0A8J3R715_9ACTN|nr:ABC transporter permease [Rugosimonospora africana]GIH21201.1 nickel ABC transporter permease [Rugosimonospora africana]